MGMKGGFCYDIISSYEMITFLICIRVYYMTYNIILVEWISTEISKIHFKQPILVETKRTKCDVFTIIILKL